MRPDAKRANRRQKRTGEARGDKEGRGQNGNTRHSDVKSRRNLGPSKKLLEGMWHDDKVGGQKAKANPTCPLGRARQAKRVRNPAPQQRFLSQVNDDNSHANKI